MTDDRRRLIVGIDPGTHTGVALWDRIARQLEEVSSMPIHEAMERVARMKDGGALHSVVIEDARLRTWFGQTGREKLQGAGSVKRDCTIWTDYLRDLGVPVRLIKPAANRTKLPAYRFAKLTGWTGRTNEHGRDAAMLCFGRTA